VTAVTAESVTSLALWDVAHINIAKPCLKPDCPGALQDLDGGLRQVFEFIGGIEATYMPGSGSAKFLLC